MAEIGPINIPITMAITASTKSQIAAIDAAINGDLVEVGQIAGKALYIRDDTRDPEQLRYIVEQIQSAFQDAFHTLSKDVKASNA